VKKPPIGIGLYIVPRKTGEKYETRLWNPVLKRIAKKQVWEEPDLNKVIQLHLQLKAKYEANNFDLVMPPKTKEAIPLPNMLTACAGLYYKFLTDDPLLVPAHKAKHRDKKYINNTVTYIKTFLSVLSKHGYIVNHCHISVVDDDTVALFYNHLEQRYQDGEIGERTYNRHFKACLYWFKTLQSLEIISKNPWEKITMKLERTDPQLIETHELHTLLDLITPDSGKASRGQQNVDYYRPWLKGYILLSVFVGGRPDQIAHLKWSHWQSEYIMIENTKVNRLKNEKGNKNYVYVHPELAQLLAILSNGRINEDDYILVPDYGNRPVLKNFVSRAFKHYWNLTGIQKEVSLNNLRHTYINALIALIGEEGFSVMNKRETAIKHYLSKKKKLELEKGKSLFSIDVKGVID
jgi:integrase